MERALEQSEKEDTDWLNEQTSILAGKCSLEFSLGNTEEGIAAFQEIRDSIRKFSQLHDIYEILRIGRARLGLPKDDVSELEPPPSESIQVKTELQQTWQGMDKHLGTEPEDPLELHKLTPSLRKTVEAIQLLKNSPRGRTPTVEEIAVNLQAKKATVASYISNINHSKKPLTFKIIPVPMNILGKNITTYDIELLSKRPTPENPLPKAVEQEVKELILTPEEKYRLGTLILALSPKQLQDTKLPLRDSERGVIAGILEDLKKADKNIERKSREVGESLQRKLSADPKKLYRANDADEQAKDLITYAGYTGRPESEIQVDTIIRALDNQ